MPDPRFFKTSPALTLESLCACTDSYLENNAFGKTVIEDVGPLHTAKKNHVSFLDNPKYRDILLNSNAGACFLKPEQKSLAPDHMIPLLTRNPYRSYALAAQYFYPQKSMTGFRSEKASIHATAKIHETSIIHDFVVIDENVEIGAHCEIHPHVTISHSLIGDHVVLYPGCRIGQDGFGFAIDKTGFVKVPQLGRVIIEGHSEIGANTTIDRGALNDTIIGMGTWIDNMVQIAHNVKIGRGCIIAAQVGISGSTEIGNYVMMGGQVGVAGHLKIGDGAKIAAKSGVTRDIPAGQEWMGYPATLMKKNLRQVVTLARLAEKNNY